MTNPFLTHYQCALCERAYALEAVTYTCPSCGAVGTLDMCYDYPALRHAVQPDQLSGWSMWRYAPLLPVSDSTYFPPLHVGWTPLIAAPHLAQRLGLRALWLKDDSRNPTGSLKDRASAMVVARAQQLGVKVITTASTGNAAAALAGLCASVGMKAVIFVPAKAPSAKIAQLLVYGATVLLVDGTYDDAYALSLQASAEYNWYCRNTGMNPYTTEGKKTAALELCEQLAWRVPDVLILSVGDGNILAGQYKGFYDLYQLGWIARMPRLIGVQAAGSDALVRAWEQGLTAEAMQRGGTETIADSISAGLPSDRTKALRAVRQTDGAFVRVSDAEILAAIPALARGSGIFAEPACAAAYAGLLTALESGLVRKGESVALLVTGSGLKDVNAAMQSLAGESGYPIGRDPAAMRQAVARLQLA
ncbi:MAG: threonine synthase [Candidatus Thermofonsia Clade 1 bacterium]|uniref:Threonine synthase n=3 Tax=Candidatus Thermofonsia Clade 1 bacterium TaxID=2364210 RepID=A0A2M8PZ93_9CHLR|nr:MAG: threonine synthase [Candidatus Thermofonsia Clade 1 bacterium]